MHTQRVAGDGAVSGCKPARPSWALAQRDPPARTRRDRGRGGKDRDGSPGTRARRGARPGSPSCRSWRHSYRTANFNGSVNGARLLRTPTCRTLMGDMLRRQNKHRGRRHPARGSRERRAGRVGEHDVERKVVSVVLYGRKRLSRYVHAKRVQVLAASGPWQARFRPGAPRTGVAPTCQINAHTPGQLQAPCARPHATQTYLITSSSRSSQFHECLRGAA